MKTGAARTLSGTFYLRAVPSPRPELDSRSTLFLFCPGQTGGFVPARERPNLGFQSDADVETVLDEFQGDAREAIRALLPDLAVLAADCEAHVTRGYIRGGVPRIVLTGRS